nr:MAG TPA: hypothetical protein [Bacteriophage sp.]
MPLLTIRGLYVFYKTFLLTIDEPKIIGNTMDRKLSSLCIRFTQTLHSL